MAGAVGIVGVGNMGGAMAARLLDEGWAVRVHDIDRAKVEALAALGAQSCGSSAEASQDVQVLIVCVVDAAQTQDVLFGPQGAASTLSAGQAVLLCPTIAPQDVEGLAARLAALGVDAIDAPMSGGPVRARDGSMSLMVACAAPVFEKHARLLATLSGKVFRIGERLGDGARTKLVNNLLAGINLAGAAEAIALASRLGLDPARTLDVIEQSSGQSWIGSDRMRRAIAGDYAPRAHVTLLRKDTALAVQAARAAGFEGPLGPRTAALFEAAVRAGLGELDDAALLRLLESHNPPPASS
jgi:putative dehydrogenase